MTQQKRKEDDTFEQVMKLVDELSPDKQEELRKNLSNRTWGKRWRQLVEDVQNDNRNLPPLTEEEVIAEMKAIKKAIRSNRAKGRD